jgi:carbonic anhydrase
MTVLETLTQRNQAFAGGRFSKDLKIIPSLKIMLIGCVDPRVDPVDVLGLGLGEAAVIRNVGGRVTPDVFDTLAMLSVVAKAGGGALGPGWNLIVLHHTDCGITRLGSAPDKLGKYFGVAPADLGALAINDPFASVKVDVAALKANPQLPAAFTVSGLVYDVATGKIEVVVPPAPLRP